MREGNIRRPTIFDHVTEEMTCGREEIFGPVLCVKRVDSFEEGLQLMNNNRFANGSVIYTENGTSRASLSGARMVAWWASTSVFRSLAVFGFTGHKQSFFGDSTAWGATAFSSIQKPRA